MLHFESSEYRARLGRVHERMAERDIDVLLLTDPCNMYYLTGYDAWSFYTPQVVIISPELSQPVWIGRGMDVAGAKETTYLSDENVIGYDDDFVQSASKDAFDYFAEVVRARGLSRRRIGLELRNFYLTARASEVLRSALPEATFTDGSLLVNWVRFVKSEAEIAFLRQGARLVESAMRAALETARPGVRECDVAATIYHHLMAGSPDFGGVYASSPPFMPSGRKTGTPHLSWTDERYQDNQPVNFELVACRLRYHSPLGRSLYLGKPPQALLDLERGVSDGIAAALEAVKPGVTCEEVEAAWRAAISRSGIEKRSRCGYSIGIAYPPTFGEQTASIRAGDRTVLEPGVAMHFMPGIWQDGRGLVMTEPFVVTPTGCELLCDFPRKLFVTG